jgi:hypothetical protein
MIKILVLVCFVIYSTNQHLIINYDDYFMDKNLIIGGDFENPKVTGVNYTMMSKILGWKIK